MEKITLSKIWQSGDEWAVVYLDPDNSYSAGGGRITVIAEGHVGSAFFSHVGQPTFKDFIAQCDSDYLIKRLFQAQKWVSVECGEEFIEYLARERMDDIKESRGRGLVTKEELRSAYEDVKELEFTDTSNLHRLLDSDTQSTLASIFDEDWWWELKPQKINVAYAYLDLILTEVILKIKELNAVIEPQEPSHD